MFEEEATRVESLAVSCRACGSPLPDHARFCSDCGFRLAPAADEPREQAGDPLVGRLIGNRYRIEAVIGRGGMGVVYRVEHVRIGKSMAMKVLHGELARDRDVMRRFRREAETISKLDHPNTVQIFDFGTAEGLSFLVMELLDGRDLGTVIDAEGVISFGRACGIVAQVCDSVHQAHQRGIVHRDLKPENVCVLARADQPEFAKVLDFGLAKLRESRDEVGNGSVTRAGFLLGTPLYMAPEQIRSDNADERVDVYAVGAMLYKMVVGVPPFYAATPLAILTKHLTEIVVPPTVRSPQRNLPPEADAIILKALEKDPANRFQTMEEFATALRGALSQVDTPTPMPRPLQLPVHAAPAATRDEFERYERRLRTQSRLMGLVLVGLAAAGATLGYQAWARRPQPIATMESEPNDDPSHTNSINVGSGLDGRLGQRLSPEQGDVDLYRFNVARSGPHRVTVSALPNIDLGLELYEVGRAEPLFVVDSGGVGVAEGFPDVPLTEGQHFVRIHEVRELGGFPTENVSDMYRVEVTTSSGESTEPNDIEARAVQLDGASTHRGYFGWTGDIDTYCVAAHEAPLELGVRSDTAIDIVIESHLPGGVLRQTNEHGPGEPESLTIPPAEDARCFHVSAAESASVRGDFDVQYELTLR